MMPLNYFELDKSEVETIIRSEEFLRFKSEMEERLNIQDIEYEIEIEDVADGEGGYKEQFTNARITFDNSYTKIEKMFFYIENIKNAINRKFAKISSNRLVFNRIIDIYVKITLIHELAHIQQFKNGVLTENTVKEEKKLAPQYRQLEIQANDIARQIISSYGNFESEIVEHIYSNIPIDDEEVSHLIEMFSN